MPLETVFGTLQAAGEAIMASGMPYHDSLHAALVAAYSVLLVPVVAFSILFYAIAVLGIRARRQPQPEPHDGPLPSVTVQIPTFNEPVAIRCAEACLAFDYPAKKLQIIIGDDSNYPTISKQIDAFAAKHRGRITVTRRGSNQGYKPGNLNYMLKHSKGEVLVIFDSDFMPEPGFLKRIVRPFADQQVACVQAKWSYANLGENVISKFASTLLMVYHNLLAPINQRLNVSLLFGSGEAVRRSVLQKLGGWKDWSMTEDVEFSLRALKEGYKNVYLKDLEVKGEVPFTQRGLSRQQKRWAYGNTRAFFDNIRWILLGKRFSLAQKSALTFTLLGYFSAPLFVAFAAVGFGVWFTGTPGSVDVFRFVTETGKILFLNSGFIFAGLVALARERWLHIGGKVFLSSLTYGILVSLSVFDGLIKAVTKRPMIWYMIPKKGNLMPAS